MLACAAEWVAKASKRQLYSPHLLSSAVRLICPIFICFMESVPETCAGESTKFEPIHQWKLTKTTERPGVFRRWGLGVGPQGKYTGSAQVNKTREKPSEIYSAQLWQVFKRNYWKWLFGDEWSPSKDCQCLKVTPLFAVLWFKHTLSNAREAFSFANEVVNFCRSSASFMWYFSASLRRTFSLNTERDASSNCLNSLQDQQIRYWEMWTHPHGS